MKNITSLALASSLLVFSGAVFAQDSKGPSEKSLTETQCDSIKTEFAAMQEQIPLKIDYMTTITGMSAMMGSTSCLVSFSYSFEEDVMVQEVVKGSQGELSDDQALAFLKSDEGRNILKTILKQQAEAIFEDVGAQSSGIRYTMTYLSDGANLKPITIQF